ncbi:Dps family protein [Opitutus terrae]|uniref:Ferritin Dps family protein n=1 Tax=Opitutus terrae (strain DSM 11246 / JCM 15787 / PB90-1) TaxID=452637 RepID=B1ZQT2_OPITP|nr:DNA starvation/stationary phase protection protein [Opitutus terrae]ACB77830.1 Ferritin Dps family protein [Opitutus terrae PB90-1]
MKTASDAKTKTDSAVVSALNLLLADSYALLANTHHAHWNVEGSDFFALHEAFQKQYEALFEAVDEIAERVRALDAYPPGGLQTLAKRAGIEEFPSGAVPARDLVAGLIVAHEKAITDAIAARDAAGDANDLETQDLAIGRIQWHQKTSWMLKSYLKAH